MKAALLREMFAAAIAAGSISSTWRASPGSSRTLASPGSGHGSHGVRAHARWKGVKTCESPPAAVRTEPGGVVSERGGFSDMGRLSVAPCGEFPA